MQVIMLEQTISEKSVFWSLSGVQKFLGCFWVQEILKQFDDVYDRPTRKAKPKFRVRDLSLSLLKLSFALMSCFSIPTERPNMAQFQGQRNQTVGEDPSNF